MTQRSSLPASGLTSPKAQASGRHAWMTEDEESPDRIVPPTDDHFFHSRKAAAVPVAVPVEAVAAGPESTAMPADSKISSQWYLNDSKPAVDINASSVWPDYTGAGVLVGIIDDGIDYTHVDLKANYGTTFDYDLRGKDSDAKAESGDKHGTAVAGVIAADDNGTGTVGVAYDATIAGFRIGYGSAGSSSQFIGALNQQVNVDVSNNSWAYATPFMDNFKSSTYSGFGSALKSGVTSGRDGLGTVFVFSAGNYRGSGDSVNYHNIGNSPYVIAVAGVGGTGKYASFSNPGAALLVAAPATSITTTDRVGSQGYSSTDYVSLAGTSFSAPIVSGVAALMLEANPDLGYRDVQEILALSARMTDSASANWTYNGATNWNGGGMHFSNDYGFGLVDAHAAARLAETWTVQSTIQNLKTASSTSSAKVTIADGNSAGIKSGVAVAGGIVVDKVQVDISITHQRMSDLRVVLVSPNGTQSILMDRPKTSVTSLNFVFTSNAFWGELSGGAWTVMVYDYATGYTGTLNGFTLTVLGDAVTSDSLYVYTDDFAIAPGASRQTLVDSAGADTLNAAAVTSDMVLDLNPGAVSTIAGKQLSVSSATVIEIAYAGDGNDTIRGNSVNNLLDGGRGNDSIAGGAGNDTLLGGEGNDTLDGGVGTDRLEGGAGDDIYVVDSIGDAIIETAGAGIDTVQSMITYTLGADVENLTLTGSANVSGTGNGLGNIMVGNSGNNILSGAGGNDQLSGGAGNDQLLGGDGDDLLVGGLGADTLAGGAGYDTFGFTHLSESGDLILDFNANGDTLDFGDLFKSIDYAGTDPIADRLMSLAFNSATDATDVWVDSDATGVAGAMLVVSLQGVAVASVTVGTDILV